MLTSHAGYINQDTILTTDYSAGGRKSGKEGAQTSATAADAPNRDPTAASRSRAARAGDSTHGATIDRSSCNTASTIIRAARRSRFAL